MKSQLSLKQQNTNQQDRIDRLGRHSRSVTVWPKRSGSGLGDFAGKVARVDGTHVSQLKVSGWYAGDETEFEAADGYAVETLECSDTGSVYYKVAVATGAWTGPLYAEEGDEEIVQDDDAKAANVLWIVADVTMDDGVITKVFQRWFGDMKEPRA